MKEQVNVEIVEFVTISKEKYDRLKRLDENVKNNIKTIDEILTRIESDYSWNKTGDDYYEELKHQKLLLESLDI